MNNRSGVIGVINQPLRLSPELERTLIPLISYWIFTTRAFSELARNLGVRLLPLLPLEVTR